MIPSSNVGEIGSVWHVLALVGALRRKTDFQIIGRSVAVLNHGNKICSVTMIMICTDFKLSILTLLFEVRVCDLLMTVKNPLSDFSAHELIKDKLL